MTTYHGIRELPLQLDEESDDGTTLLQGAGVLRLAVGIEAALVADADAAAVEGTTVGSYLGETTVTGDSAVTADVVVIADVDEPTHKVVAPQLFNTIVAIHPCGRTVDYDETDRVVWHRDATLDIGEEPVLVLDEGTGNGQRILFLNHKLYNFELTIKYFFRLQRYDFWKYRWCKLGLLGSSCVAVE